MAITLQEKILGFAIYGEEEGSNRKKIFRLMIDKNLQNRGYGKKAMILIIEEMFSDPSVEEIVLCYHPRSDAADRFYKNIGFHVRSHIACQRVAEGKIEAHLNREHWRFKESQIGLEL